MSSGINKDSGCVAKCVLQHEEDENLKGVLHNLKRIFLKVTNKRQTKLTGKNSTEIGKFTVK